MIAFVHFCFFPLLYLTVVCMFYIKQLAAAELSTIGCTYEPSEVKCCGEVCKCWNASMVPRIAKEH